jgi:hypothetical protein
MVSPPAAGRPRLRAAPAAATGAVAIALLATLWRPFPLVLWNASAGSPAGLYQVGPARRVARGEMVVAWAPERARVIAAERRYLLRMHDRFGYPGLFAAYNAGPGRYAEYLARARRRPAETLAYVAALGLARPNAPASGQDAPLPSPLFVFRAKGPVGAAPASPAVGLSQLFVALSEAPVKGQ